jgi:hypothetical protein
VCALCCICEMLYDTPRSSDDDAPESGDICFYFVHRWASIAFVVDSPREERVRLIPGLTGRLTIPSSGSFRSSCGTMRRDKMTEFLLSLGPKFSGNTRASSSRSSVFFSK